MISLTAAQHMIAMATAEAKSLNVIVAVAVCDAEGHAVAIARMDGMGAFAAESAWDQAVNYVAGLVDEGYGQEADYSSIMKGLKMIKLGEVVEGIVSVFGAEPEQNDEIALAALAAL